MARRNLNFLMILPPLVFLALRRGGLRRASSATTPTSCRAPSSASRRPGSTAPSPSATTRAPTAADLTAPGVKLVNFWASWCGPCRVEHPVLTALAAEGVPVIGINYKDDPDKARAFLAELGDPYAKIGADDSGRTGLDWGIYGVPETFVVDGAGKVVMRYPGPLDRGLGRDPPPPGDGGGRRRPTERRAGRAPHAVGHAFPRAAPALRPSQGARNSQREAHGVRAAHRPKIVPAATMTTSAGHRSPARRVDARGSASPRSEIEERHVLGRVDVERRGPDDGERPGNQRQPRELRRDHEQRRRPRPR